MKPATRPLVEVRKPPVDAQFALHHPRAPGKCPWCGEEITERTPVRKQLKTMHSRCSLEIGIITSPDQARRAVLERDQGICVDCGEDWSQRSKFIPLYRDRETKEPLEQYVQQHQRGETWPAGAYWFTSKWQPCEGFYPFVELQIISLWNNDHKIPLWKVSQMPALQRLEYFKLANMVTRCEPCHQIKTAEEAGERAKYNARDPEIEQAHKPKRQWKSRPMRDDFKPRVRDINDE